MNIILHLGGNPERAHTAALWTPEVIANYQA